MAPTPPIAERPRHDDAPAAALAWHAAGQGAALATVVDTWGSAPRPAGSQLAVRGDGSFLGSVSGGCVEGAVVLEAQEAIGDGRARLLDYGVSDGDAFAVGLACGGRIRVLVEPVGPVLPDALLEQLVAARAERRALAYVTSLARPGSGRLDSDGHAARLRADRSGVEADGDTLVVVHNPPLRMAILGAVHIAQALVPMARLAGHDPMLIDPRPGFAAPARFPGEVVRDAWPDAALRELGLDARSSVVLLTHDPKLDDPALEVALHSEAFYIGALGSRRTHAARCERLRAAGLDTALIERIHAPVGLDIGAASPGEIAVAIMAEVTAVLRGGQSPR